MPGGLRWPHERGSEDFNVYDGLVIGAILLVVNRVTITGKSTLNRRAAMIQRNASMVIRLVVGAKSCGAYRVLGQRIAVPTALLKRLSA